MKIELQPFRPIYPSPPSLITTADEQGKPNVCTIAECFNISIRQPVIVGIAIAPPRYSNELIRHTREFVINLPTAAMVKQVDLCGSCSGRTTDKFALTGLTPLPAAKVRPPLIAECPVNVECKLMRVESIGDHDLFIAEVVAEHASQHVLTPDGKIDVGKLDMLCYANSQYWSAGEYLNAHGFTRKR